MDNEATRREIDLQMIGAHVGQSVVEYIRRQTRTCLSCSHFDEKAEICVLYSRRPPAKIIAFGCPDYSEAPPF